MCRPVGRPGSVWLGGPVAALRCVLLRRPHRVVEGTYQREHKEKDPRSEGIGKVEDEEMKERRVIRPLAHRAEVAPAARAEREREVSLSVARGVARELSGERALLLVPARRCQMDQGLSRFSILSVSRESSDKQRTDLENVYIYSIHRYHECDERIRDLRLSIEDLSSGVWRSFLFTLSASTCQHLVYPP